MCTRANTFRRFANTFLLTLFLIVVLTACDLVLEKYYHRITRIAYDLVSYDSRNLELWMTDITEGKLNIYLVEKGKPTKDSAIYLPENTAVWQLCSGFGAIWIETSNPSDNGSFVLYKVTTENRRLEEKLRTDEALGCKVFAEQIVFWGANNIFIVGDNQMLETRIDVVSESSIRDVAIDDSDTFWLSTVDGRVYRQGQVGWQLWDQLPGDPALFFDDNGGLWAATHEGVYQYPKILDQTILVRKEIVKKDLGFTRELIEDSHRRIWVIGSNVFFAIYIDSGQILEIFPPNSSTLFRFGGIDTENEFMFISTENGVYRFDLHKYP